MRHGIGMDPAPTETRPSFARRAFAARFGGLPRAFWGVFWATLINRLGGVIEPFLALYLASRGFSIAEVGVLLALSGAGSMLGQLLGGVSADRFGRRQTYLAGMVGAAAMFALLGVADATWLIVAAAFMAGLFLDFYRPASQAIVNDLLDGEARVRAFGLLFWVVNVGFATAAVMAGVLAERGYTLLFVVDAITCVIAGVIVYVVVRGDTRPEGHADTPGGLADVLRDRAFLAFCAVTLLQASVYMQMFTTFPLAMREDGFGPSSYGLVAAINGIVIVVAQPVLLPYLTRRDPLRVLATGIVLIGAGFGVVGLTGEVWAYALPVVVWTIGEILVNTVGPSLVAALSPDHLRGRYAGVWGTTFSLAFVLAPLVGGPVLGAYGDRALWSGCAVVCAIAAAGALMLRPRAT